MGSLEISFPLNFYDYFFCFGELRCIKKRSQQQQQPQSLEGVRSAAAIQISNTEWYFNASGTIERRPQCWKITQEVSFYSQNCEPSEDIRIFAPFCVCFDLPKFAPHPTPKLAPFCKQNNTKMRLFVANFKHCEYSHGSSLKRLASLLLLLRRSAERTLESISLCKLS